jgi:hypothetical protein
MGELLFDDQRLVQDEQAKDKLGAVALRFSGADVTPKDTERLTGQLLKIYAVMKASDQWLSLAEVHDLTGAPVASISAQLRNLRKREFGSHVIHKRHRCGAERGLFEYKLLSSEPKREATV